MNLAVLPFAKLTGDPKQEHLSDGFTQEMITQLGRLHPQSLSVIARTSVMRYKEGGAPVDRIGRELGVDHVLEGSVQREGGASGSPPSSYAWLTRRSCGPTPTSASSRGS